MKLYEVCVGSYREAIIAAEKGAHRIELCDNLMEDGTTPGYGTIKAAVNNIKVPIMVIIRPRGGEFVFTDEEVEIMIDDVKMCKKLGAYGVVIGALKDAEIDKETIKKIVDIAKPMSITFHMAFDEIHDMNLAIDQLVELGVDRILTKGGHGNAMEGKDKLKELVEYANGRIIIMPGKGVNVLNRDLILEHTGAKEIHGTKVV